MSLIKYYSGLLVIIILPQGIQPLQAQSGDAEVLEYHKKIEVVGTRLSQEIEVAIRINNREGHFMTRVDIPFSPSTKIKDLTATIEDSNGQEVKKLKKKDISEASSIAGYSLYEDDFIKSFELSHNRYPYVLKYSYTISFNGFLSVDEWTPVLSLNTNTNLATLTVVTSSDFKISIHEQNISPGKVLKDGDKVTYEWKSDYVRNEVKPEFYSPSIKSLLPYVSIVPIKFEYGLEGSFQSWNAYGEWLEKLSYGLQDLPESEKNTILELTRNLPDRTSKAKALYHYLQDNVRYINVSIGIGGMLPYPASYVAQNKYGDCKALTNYMKTLLAEVGIESFCVDVYAEETPNEIIKDFPSQQFNHVILAVPTESDTLWLETTSNTNPFGYLGTFTQNRNALFVNSSESKIVRVPALTNDQVTRKTLIKGVINDKNDIKAKIEVTFKGDDFETLLYYLKSGMLDDAHNYIRTRLPYSKSSSTITEIKHETRDSPEIRVIVEIDLSDQGQEFGDAKVLRLPSLDIPRFERPESRKTPLFFPYPIHFIEELNYSVGDKIKAKITTGVDSVKSEFGSYSVISAQKGRMISVKREFLLKSGKYTIEDYARFYEFISTIDHSISKTLITLK